MDILVIEDCIDTFNLVKKSLDPHSVLHSQSIKNAKDYLKEEKPSLFIIDVDLPDGNGIEFCTELNTHPVYKDIPKIILTANSRTSDKVFGLYSGADDYITKPFSPLELRARCEIKIKKNHSQEKIITVMPFRFDLEFQSCSICDEKTKKEINLTPIEFKILYTLVNHNEKVFTRHDLVRKIWKTSGTSIETRGLDTHISHIRKKIYPYSKSIVSIYGKGYAFKSIINID